MSSALLRFIFTSFFALAGIALAGGAAAQVQDTIWEKTYCLDDKGTEIRFEYVNGRIPPNGTGAAHSAYIEGDVDRLYDMPYEAAQFLFARACFEAANINLDLRQSEPLECQTATFLSRRFSTGPRELLQVVTELSRQSETRAIARALKNCF